MAMPSFGVEAGGGSISLAAAIPAGAHQQGIALGVAEGAGLVVIVAAGPVDEGVKLGEAFGFGRDAPGGQKVRSRRKGQGVG